ncbi:hypothetical protein HMI54_003528, partial [Coelomomyces lativittatus]
KPCSTDCTVDPLFANAECKNCDAKCPEAHTTSWVIGTQTCSLKILTAPQFNGKACNVLASRPCTVTCPVDCTYKGPEWEVCSANCASPTVSQTGYYNMITSELNGGKPCIYPTPTTRRCSHSESQYSSECRKDCVVTGNPIPQCSDVCKHSNETVVEYVYSYTQFATFPTLGGSPCPTHTTSCNCVMPPCELFPYPTSTDACDANCRGNQGIVAKGFQLYHYPIYKTGEICTTTSYKPCTTSCICVYTTSTPVGDCVASTTVSTTTPWVVRGIQKYSAMGTVPTCNTVINAPCTSTLQPIDCSIFSECRPCTCSSILNEAYTLTSTIPCSYQTLRTPAFGGAPCPDPFRQPRCNQLCGGCEEDMEICDCMYTTSTTNANNTQFLGTQQCIYPLKTNNPACTTRTRKFPQVTCNSTGTYPFYPSTLLQCNNLCTLTSTFSNQLPYTGFGFKECTFERITELTASLPSSSVVNKISSNFDCTKTLSPTDCSIAYRCPTPTTSCNCTSPILTLSETLTCSSKTLQKAMYGGQCNFPASTLTEFTTVCKPQGTILPFEDYKEYHVIIFGIFKTMYGVIEGRLAVAENATMLNFTIGQGLYGNVDLCDVPLASLIVGGSLNMAGRVYNGETHVHGVCSGDIKSSCPVRCGGNGCFMNHSVFPFLTVYTRIKQWSTDMALMESTGKLYLSTWPTSSVFLEFSGQPDLEIINVYPSPMFTWWAGYRGTVAPTATIVINMFGNETVSMRGLNLEFFGELKTRIIWNFPYATEVILQTMTLPGLVVAPYATLLGDGNFQGSVYALNLISDNASPSFSSFPFNGKFL